MTMTGTTSLRRAFLHVHPGAVARGAGVALACLASTPRGRSRILFAAYAIGWPLSKPGLRVIVVVPDSEEPWKRATVPFLTSVASWSVVMLLATAGIRRTKVPPPLAAVVLGGAAFALDTLLADLAEEKQSHAAAEEGHAQTDGQPTGDRP